MHGFLTTRVYMYVVVIWGRVGRSFKGPRQNYRPAHFRAHQTVVTIRKLSSLVHLQKVNITKVNIKKVNMTTCCCFSKVTHSYQYLLARDVLGHAVRMFPLYRHYHPSAICTIGKHFIRSTEFDENLSQWR